MQGQVLDAWARRRTERDLLMNEIGAVALRDKRVPMPEIVGKLIIKSGKNAGKHPSAASLYRALAEAGDSSERGEEALALRPVAARITGLGGGTGPELMRRLQGQIRPR